jgi:hypothetical protein
MTFDANVGVTAVAATVAEQRAGREVFSARVVCLSGGR